MNLGVSLYGASRQRKQLVTSIYRLPVTHIAHCLKQRQTQPSLLILAAVMRAAAVLSIAWAASIAPPRCLAAAYGETRGDRVTSGVSPGPGSRHPFDPLLVCVFVEFTFFFRVQYGVEGTQTENDGGIVFLCLSVNNWSNEYDRAHLLHRPAFLEPCRKVSSHFMHASVCSSCTQDNRFHGTQIVLQYRVMGEVDSNYI